MGSPISQSSHQFQDNVKSRLKYNMKYGEMWKRHLIPFYDPRLVNQIYDNFRRDRDSQHAQNKKVREALVAMLGSRQSFRQFRDVISVESFMNALESVCQEYVSQYHDLLINNQVINEKLLGANIIEKLKDRYSGDTNKLHTDIQYLETVQ